MTHPSPESETTFGYLSAVYVVEHGYFGGYLILSAGGRPLEFHCTAPVLPSRAQQILYGPTLDEYLIGEQIGGTLLGVAKLAPQLIVTNHAGMAGLRARIRVPLVLLGGGDNLSPVPAISDDERCPSGGAGGHRPMVTGFQYSSWCEPFALGSHQLQLPLGFASEQAAVLKRLGELGRRVELAEPFDRIQEAIHEAQRIGRRGPEAHGQAA